MPQLTECPDRDTLDRLMLGLLPQELAEPLESHVLGCSHCAQELSTLVHRDTLVEALRNAPLQEPEEPIVLRLIERLMQHPPRRSVPEGTGPVDSAPVLPTTSHRTGSEPIAGVAGAGSYRWIQLEPPCRFGRYRVLETLGEGGMGAVYLAEDTQLRRPVAIKVPFFSATTRESVQARFLHEARSAAALHHPNICPIHDVGEIDGIPYLTMAYVEGRPLYEQIVRGPLPPAQALELVGKLARALQHAHEAGVVHRDLKPSNIMTDARGEPVIMDFGLARRQAPGEERLTRTGQVMGTPSYMAPEQFEGDPQTTSPACDIYSLGVILYELLTGRPPFSGELLSMLQQIAHRDPEPPSSRRSGLDPRLDAICLKAIAKQPSQRFGSMSEFADTLAECLATPAPRPESVTDVTEAAPALPKDPPVTDSASAPAQTVPARPHRSTVTRIAAALLLVGLLVAAVTLLRIRTPNGTVIIEMDQPGAVVLVDGNRIELTPAGLEGAYRIELKAGEHEMTISKDDFVTQTRRFTIKSGDRQTIQVRLEPPKVPREMGKVPAEPATLTEAPAATAVDLDPWISEVRRLPADEQLQAVIAKLMEINPGYDGEHVSKIASGKVVVLSFNSDRVADVSPLRALRELDTLNLSGSYDGQVSYGQVSDLSPLGGMKLTSLGCSHTQVSDLSPLAGARLKYLQFPFTKVSDLSPLAGMNLERIVFTPGNIHKGIDLVRGMSSMREIGDDWNRRLVPDKFWASYDAGAFGKPPPMPE